MTTAPKAAAPASTTVAGWKLVPIEPTDAMLDAAAHASMQHLLDCISDPKRTREVGSEEMVRKTHASRYSTMLSAAPVAPLPGLEYAKYEHVGTVQHLHELNDSWMQRLPVGTRLYIPTPPQQATLPLPVMDSRVSALRWLLNITTESDRKDVGTRQAAKLLDGHVNAAGRTHRELLEDLWCLLSDNTSITPATPPQQATPDGWKLVPIEPTQDMIDAYDRTNPEDHWVRLPDAGDGTTRRERPGDASIYYRAMLAATPPQQATPAYQMVECEDCDGRGEVGEPYGGGEFQPPERDRCTSCDGSGKWKVDAIPAEVELVSLATHNMMTVGPCPWTNQRVPLLAYQRGRSAFGTTSADDDKRVYRTLQAALHAIAESTAPAASPIVAAQLDPLAEECARLQSALAFWMPDVPPADHPLHARVAADAYLLCGFDGNCDEPSAYEQGLIKLTAPIAQLIERWEERARKAFPTDAMLINRHVRELHEALATRGAAA